MTYLKNIVLVIFSTYLLAACTAPVDKLRQAKGAPELRQLWQSHQALFSDYTAQAQEFRELMYEKVRALPNTSEPDAFFLHQQLQLQLAQRPIHYNFIVVPDLSMRISPAHYPRNFEQDPEVIGMVLEVFLQHVEGKYFGHKDRIVLRPTDLQQVPDFGQYAPSLTIDFSGVGMSEARDFMEALPERKAQFMQAVGDMYQAVAENGHRGADIWKFLDEDLDAALLRHSTDSDSIRNVLVMVTDGYIEANKYGQAYCRQNECEYLSNYRIQDFRRKVLQSGRNWEQLFEAEGYGITPVGRPERFAGLEVICLEFYDRFPKKQPSDYQITRRFWQAWFRQMGIRAMIDKTRETPEDTKRRVVQFLEN